MIINHFNRTVNCHIALFFVLSLCLVTINLDAAETPTGDNLPHGKDYFILRDGLSNCRIKFERTKTGRVVFMGGSITNMNGWRQMVCKELQRRFPETKFEFINAGIPSTGSVPASYRIVRDVFSKGGVDLLFEEAAVNDKANRINPKQWVRGMEGVIRHARQINPSLDIVMMHFVDPEKMTEYNAGKTPEVIAAHEKVASHYHINSIHLAKEVAERIKAGQFTWKNDFRNLHPSRFGHQLYTSTISRLFDKAWSKSLTAKDQITPHKLPKKVLDPFSYTDGHLVGLKKATIKKGWQLDPKWKPRTQQQKAGTRPGFVDVPMLVAEEPGAELTFAFTGRAVGIWIIAGPDVGMIEYRIDRGPWKKHDQFTQWSRRLHIPWTLVLSDELKNGRHVLTLRTLDKKNENSKGYACRIVNFCVNGKE